ncbi:MAG: helix-turn-helix transcriptional regulator [Armatimonadetes bacterium]|nr:helix-turn-helix transcriptional regulator [Armatimonadota bacterium]
MMEGDGVRVGRRIREERERLGKRLEEVAGAIGVSESYLSRIERGERGLDSLVLRKISTELSVPMDRFFIPTSFESVHARSGEESMAAMTPMMEWGRKIQDDLEFVLHEGGRHAR